MITKQKTGLAPICVFLSLLRITNELGAHCIPGEILPGPTCFSFYKCVKGRLFVGTKRFECPPTTFFDKRRLLCVHDRQNECPSTGPSPPAPLPPALDEGAFNKPPGIVPGPPGQSPSLPPENYPDFTEETICPQYEIDTSGVYDCASPGLFPSYGDCFNFYICVNTMGCIVKGFSVSCPKGHVFDSGANDCKPLLSANPCPYAQDDANHKKVSAQIKLSKHTQAEFFKGGKHYWKLMEFLDSEHPVQHRNPGSAARGSQKHRFSLG